MAFEAARRPLIALALVAGVTATAATARAEEGGVFDFALGLVGLGNDEKPDITYRERAPLVVPPKMQELPPPQQSASAGNPAWPQDPDVLRRKKAEEERRRPRPSTNQAERDLGRPLTAAERNAGYRPGGGVPSNVSGTVHTYTGNADHYWNDPSMITELKRQNDDLKAQTTPVVPGQEPERRFLTDPPSGYRSPSAKAALTVPEEPFKRKSKLNGEPITDLE
jgi:hypothetical protein